MPREIERNPPGTGVPLVVNGDTIPPAILQGFGRHFDRWCQATDPAIVALFWRFGTGDCLCVACGAATPVAEMVGLYLPPRARRKIQLAGWDAFLTGAPQEHELIYGVCKACGPGWTKEREDDIVERVQRMALAVDRANWRIIRGGETPSQNQEE